MLLLSVVLIAVNKLPSNRLTPTTVSWTQIHNHYRMDTLWKRKITRNKRLGRPQWRSGHWQSMFL